MKISKTLMHSQTEDLRNTELLLNAVCQISKPMDIPSSIALLGIKIDYIILIFYAGNNFEGCISIYRER